MATTTVYGAGAQISANDTDIATNAAGIVTTNGVVTALASAHSSDIASLQTAINEVEQVAVYDVSGTQLN